MKQFLSVIFLLYSTGIQSQNLVDNWSFEDTVHCPTGLTDITAATGWKIYRNSPDFFNTCNQTTVGVPNNTIDYQWPHVGDSYAGIIAFHVNGTNIREVLGRQLNTTLQVGLKYFVSLYVVRAVNESFNWKVNIANNNIGVSFSTIEYGFPNGAWPINNISQVYTDSIIIDTVAWTKISGSFTADSAYNYIGISNFFHDSLTNTITFGNNVQSYYFVDDICVSSDSLFCDQLLSVESPESSFTIKIFPNPARDWIVTRGENIQSLQFYDVSGRLARNFTSPTPVTIDVSSFSAGIYFVAVETKNGTAFQKLIINH